MASPDSNEDLLELLSQSGKAVFAIDSSDRIVLWNAGEFQPVPLKWAMVKVLRLLI